VYFNRRETFVDFKMVEDNIIIIIIIIIIMSQTISLYSVPAAYLLYDTIEESNADSKAVVSLIWHT